MKDIGAAAEYLFASECLYRGYVPNWPSTETMPYDMIIDTGPARLRVQVKGTDLYTETINFRLKMRDKSRVRSYSAKDVDFVVLYLFRASTWYILPIDKVKTGIQVSPANLWCKSREFKNAWHLLNEESE